MRWPTPRELKKLREEEMVSSNTDLSVIRKKFAEQSEGAAKENAGQGLIRNHGLFSKAEKALEIAGWSESARADIEIFKLNAADGLTPLLMVLNEIEPTGPTNASGLTTAAVTAGKPDR